MRRRALVALFALVLFTAPWSLSSLEASLPDANNDPRLSDSEGRDTVMIGPPSRQAELQSPSDQAVGELLPLVIALHGFSEYPVYVYNFFQGANSVNDNRHLLLTPYGTENPDGYYFWNGPPACCDFYDQNIDDVSYLSSLIDTAVADHGADPERVMLIGHSNGGFMSHRMACDAGNKLHTIINFAGATYGDFSDCSLTGYPNIVNVHGTSDSVVDYNGGEFGGEYFASAPGGAAFWAQRSGCDVTSTQVGTLDLVGADGENETSQLQHLNCTQGNRITHWKLSGVDHNPSFPEGSLINAAFDWAFNSDDAQSTNGGNGSSGPSDLAFGSQSGSNFKIDPGVTTFISMNITNLANFSDSANVSVSTQSGWDISWMLGNGNPTVPVSIPLDAAEMDWVSFSISVPEVVNGAPLAHSKHPFTVHALSAHDGAEIQWSFTVEVLPWHGAVIDSFGAEAIIYPNDKISIPVTIRNIGNIEKSIAARVVPIDAEGNPLAGYSPVMSYVYNDWGVGLVEIHNIGVLGPNQNGTVQLEIASPTLNNGSIRVGFQSWSAGSSSQVSQINFDVSIDWQRNGDIAVTGDCDIITPEEDCELSLHITNIGNYQDSFELAFSSSNSWFSGSFSDSVFDLPKNDWTEVTLTLSVAQNTTAFLLTNGDITLSTSEGTVVDSAHTQVRVGAIIDWEITAVEETIDDLDNITIAFTLQNIGNADDGLDVTVSTNVYTDFGLIPPQGADWSSLDNSPNYFEMLDIPPETKVTFRAWMQIPRDQESNGTALLTIEMRSVLEPDILFTNSTAHDYPGEKWRPENIEEDDSLEVILEGMRIFWNNWNNILISVIVVMIGSLALHRAVLHRQTKDEQWRKKQELKAQPPETSDDWMGKFDGGERAGEAGEGAEDVMPESPEMDALAFTTAFKMRSGKTRPVREGPEANVVKAATTVLEHHDKSADLSAMEYLASDLLTDNPETHPANVSLPESEAETTRTVRKERSISKEPKAESDDDDLDLDL